MQKIEEAKKQTKSIKWLKYRVAPIQQQADYTLEFAKNFTKQDGTFCAASIAMLFIELRDYEQRISDLECEIRELRSEIMD